MPGPDDAVCKTVAKVVCIGLCKWHKKVCNTVSFRLLLNADLIFKSHGYRNK